MSWHYRVRVFFVLLWDELIPLSVGTLNFINLLSILVRCWNFTYDDQWCDGEQHGLTARQALKEAYADLYEVT